MRASSWRVLLPLLLAGACSFPDYTIAPEEQPSTCDDGKQGTNETGVDCGGVCQACDFVPTLPVCNDDLRGEHETGVDCGGVCPPCNAYQDCVDGNDCESGNCDGGVCQEPKCNDGIKNGAESDIDCSGNCSSLCSVAAHCNSEADCSSGVCTKLRCVSSECNDGVTNGSETGIDCGGSDCVPCPLGQACTRAGDCTSGNCDMQQLRCVAAGCQNTELDVGETDIDCGGASCAPCVPEKRCLLGRDCTSSVCNASKSTCANPTCADQVANQDESDADCGGATCPRCAVGAKCRDGGDCVSTICQSKLCVPKSSTGAPLDQTGWKATASDTFYQSSPSSFLDGNASARWTSGASQAAGMWVQVDMVKVQILFDVTLDASEWPADSGKSYNVYWSLDGTFNDSQKKAFSAGKPKQRLSFDNAIVARFVKIELTTPGTEWWSIGELVISQ